jgi:hypothetical protein
MRVELKHVHTVRKVLADGSVATYYYAWRRGPRLKGEPGSAEFLRSYEEARSEQRAPDQWQFRSIISQFKTSAEFTHNIRERTRKDYLRQLSKIEQNSARYRLQRSMIRGSHANFASGATAWLIALGRLTTPGLC